MTQEKGIGPPLTVPIPNWYAACSPTCELLDQSVERSAILMIALRRLAYAHHRAHVATGGGTWPQCPEHFCKMAHEAVNGQLTLGNKTASGRIVALVPAKEGS